MSMPSSVQPVHGAVSAAPSALRDPAAWMRTQDTLAILLVISLPWSTSAVAIIAALFVLALLPTLELRTFARSLKLPANATVIALFILGAVGMLWAVDASWSERLRGFGQLGKLLMIPLLLYHFQRSERGVWAMIAFAIACTILLIWSWLTWRLFPNFVFSPTNWPGVPVKNYITQSQEFTLCALAFAGLGYRQFRRGRITLAISLILLSFAFVADMLFVVSARTALVYLPVLIVLFALCHLNRKTMLALMLAVIAIGALAWATSPYLRLRVTNIAAEYELYKDQNAITSTGERLEYWRKSLRFFSEAPVIGHGTGSTRDLFVKDAVGQTGVSAEVIGNPHNQTLNVAVQWGVLGIIALYAMWYAHLRLFLRDDLFSWIGLVAVVENFTSSLLNSHITDFNEGWLYVLAVGIAGGLVLKREPGTVTAAAPVRD
jgi:hypothetical protein